MNPTLNNQIIKAVQHAQEKHPFFARNPECMDRLQNIPELAAIEDRMTQVLMRWQFTKPSMRRAEQ